MTQPRARNGQFRRRDKGEHYRQQFELLHGKPSRDDEYARTIWTGAGIIFLGYLAAVIIARAVGAG